MSELLALGISHKTAPVALRERLAFTEPQASEFARALTASAEVREAVVISTCNRTEVYLVVGDPVRAAGRGRRARPARPPRRDPPDRARGGDLLAAQLRRRAPALPRDRGPGVDDRRRGRDPGPGQARLRGGDARPGCTGPLSNRLFAAALTTGKRVRSETGIGASRVSVPSVAVDLALSVLGGLEERHVVILGAGETSELTARALADQGAGTIFVANRHADRALSLAQRFGGSVVGLDGLPEQLAARRHRALLDLLAASDRRPRGARAGDGERAGGAAALLLDRHRGAARHRPGCGELEGVTLYDIDDLQAVVARNLSTRASEAPRAQEIVEEEIHRFARWLGQLDTLPTVSALREHGNALVEQVLAENAGRWESASPRDLARVEAIARAVMSRLLHEPTIRLRSLSEERGHASLELVRELFGLRDERPGVRRAAQETRRPPPAPLAEVHDLQRRRQG